ncbi:molecular chaperone [Aliidiomarina minuta]|uniref:Molecular chaperone n=1 Tax=Aliidiomarina minuta TaxID=880057 RepID=A0A432W9H4_9GAMM|nr:fimbria/pilus periplasmic chaperone [Aliidiomarina minuta]RUO26695.1 molecular chaperone [Aliidiomarina minuta]
MKTAYEAQQVDSIRLLFCSCLGVIALFLFMLPAQASSFSVKPIRVQLSADRPVFALQVTNSSSQPVSIQLDARKWTQQDNEDIYSETTEILAVPPIFTINGGETQTVRVGMRRTPDQNTELSYRLYLRELPAEDRSAGIKMALNIGVPVFIRPLDSPAKHALQWAAGENSAGEPVINATNNGSGHAQVTALNMMSGEQEFTRTMNTYVLPGATRQWALPPDFMDTSASGLELKARVNGKDQSSLISLD